ncbi:MAG TPA: glycosyltransferase family 2 protein, partial [Acidimicrobiia bacterium]|nr:glycosyltransferase family 2 protein [Acidimicrobiia bacterium]
EVLPRALESIENQTYPHIVEVVVAAADEASARAGAGVAVVDNPEGSTPAGLNLAIAASSGEVIVRCDAQSILPPEYISRAVETLMRTGAANVGGMQVPVGETKREKAIAAAMSSPFGAGDARYRIGGEEGSVETVYLGVFRRDALERVGGFDESFIRNQDYELNHRLIESGETVWFDPELQVRYRPRGSLGSLARQYFEYGRAKRAFVRRHRGSLRWRQLAAPIVTVILLGALLVSIWVPAALLLLLAYATALIVVGFTIRGRNAIQIFAALATMHLSWGWGFLLPDRSAHQ